MKSWHRWAVVNAVLITIAHILGAPVVLWIGDRYYETTGDAMWAWGASWIIWMIVGAVIAWFQRNQPGLDE